MNHFRLFRAGLIAVLFAFMALFFVGCGGSGSGTTGSRESGTLEVRMADAAGNDITSAIITVTQIDAHIDGTWQTVYTGSQTVDLLDLRNTDLLLGSALVPAGQYTQVRIFVSSATTGGRDLG